MSLGEKKKKNQRQSEVYSPLVRASQSVHSALLCFLCLAHADMAGIPDNEWEPGWEAWVPPRLLPLLNQTTDGSEARID